MKRKPTEADILMWDQLEDLPIWAARAKEWTFCDDRKWRFDFVILSSAGWPEHGKTAIEIEGGAWSNGAHVRGKRFISDMEKYNHAALLGWRVLRFTPQQVLDGSAIAFIKRVLDS